MLQQALPGTYVYKAFNTIGLEHLAQPSIDGTKLTMLIAGAPEKRDVAEAIVRDVGFQPVYVGPIRYARNLEALAELWIHMGVDPVPGGAVKLGRDFHFQLIRSKDA